MPTAAKGFAAVAFALLGWAAAAVLVPGLPESTDVGWLREWGFAAGLIIGWHVSGREAGRGFVAGVGTGLRTGVLMVAAVILCAAIWAMLRSAVQRHYPGPFEALGGMVGYILRYGGWLGYPPFLGVMIAGSALLGAMTEVVGRRWR